MQLFFVFSFLLQGVLSAGIYYLSSHHTWTQHRYVLMGNQYSDVLWPLNHTFALKLHFLFVVSGINIHCHKELPLIDVCARNHSSWLAKIYYIMWNSTLRNHFLFICLFSLCWYLFEQCLVETCCCNHHRCYKTCWWWLTFGCFSFIWHTALVLHVPFQKRYNTLHWQKTSGSAPLGSVPVQFSLLSFILSQS